MTNPPHGPSGGRPSNYGGQQPPGFPQHRGGFGQPQGPHQGGYQQHGSFGHLPPVGGGPANGKSNKKIIAIVAGVVGVLLVAFLVTGLWAPGFLVGDDDDQASPPATAPPSTAPSNPGQMPPPLSGPPSQPPTSPSAPPNGGIKASAAQAAKAMDGYLAAVRKHDTKKAKKFACGLADPGDDIKKKLKATRADAPTLNSAADNSFKSKLTGTYKGKKLTEFAEITTGADGPAHAQCVLLVME